MAVLIIFLAAVTLLIAWYGVSLRRKYSRAQQVLSWIQTSLEGRGQVLGMAWTSSSQFQVSLRLTCGVFHQASAIVELRCEPTPFQWLLNKLHHRREVLIFQADLDLPPAFSLQVHNFRWFARNSRKVPMNLPGWRFEHMPALVIATRPEQQKDIACTMASLSRSNSADFLNISFQRSSPQFSATLLLESLAPGSPERMYVLDAMRELAGSSSASLF